MTITLELQSDIGEKLLGKANAHGMNIPEYLGFLAEQDVKEAQFPADLFEGYPAIDPGSENDLVTIQAGVERGKADLAEGRYKSAAEFQAVMKARYGLPDWLLGCRSD